ncbi:MAG: cysteine--tRNA ligase [Bradyrhizobium sp.]|uniref:cysteine--tRNA ligase n=1 Tax=Bradyrhizobium sp. TaxID=376 RepID=UPI003BB05963
MQLRLYDTLTREKRVFTPLDPANVRMYVCGPTVYDFAHIGNARPVIVFDVLFRVLRHLYGEKHVTYVRNITDVDDKINDRAARDFPGLPLNEAIRKVTEQTANQFHADVAGLGSLPPTYEPRATDFVLPRADGKADMVTLIKELIARGHAYEAGGEVLFDVQSMPDYGALSGRKLDEQLAGARVAVDSHKKNPADFVLWKLSSENEPGWDSPWGRGRPGWHIECSAMSAAYLGETFDIHGGGLDLIFPHHENEIAQSRCAHGTATMANYWMHNGFLEVEGAKMSKSLGNFVTIRELLNDWPGEALRLNMLKTHYRSPIDWTLKSLEESKRVVDSWYDIVGDDTQATGGTDEDVLSLLGDDLNTSGAITRLHAIAASRTGSSGKTQIDIKRTLKVSAMLLGLLGKTKTEYVKTDPKAVAVNKDVVDALLADRTAARARKDFKESDRIRDELAAMGVVIKDSKEGTTWEVAR